MVATIEWKITETTDPFPIGVSKSRARWQGAVASKVFQQRTITSEQGAETIE